jgi:hypothetical protein
MIHIRVDQQELNSKRKFACGIGPALPAGDQWYYDGEHGANKADCPRCNPDGPRPIGWPASSMNGNASARHADPEAWNRWLAFCAANGAP